MYSWQSSTSRLVKGIWYSRGGQETGLRGAGRWRGSRGWVVGSGGKTSKWCNVSRKMGRMIDGCASWWAPWSRSSRIIQIKIIPCNFCQRACWHKINRKRQRIVRKDKLVIKYFSLIKIRVDEETCTNNQNPDRTEWKGALYGNPLDFLLEC